MSQPSTYTIPVQGMTCASCSGRVERALGKLPETRASVNLATEQAHVEAPAGSLEQLIQTIHKAGYEVPEQTLELDIEGMTCASCSARIERVLARRADVIECSVNLATEKARVRVLQNTPPDEIIRAIEKAGYGARASGASQSTAGLPKRHERDWLPVALSLLLALPLMIPMLGHLLGQEWPLPPWLQFLLATPVQFLLGARFYVAAAKAVRARAGNMDLLVALGTSAAYGLSIQQWLTRPDPHLYFEASAVVISLVLLGKYLETRAKRQTSSAIQALEALRPTFATRLQDQQETQVPISQIEPGDIIIVKPGESIPVDGEIIDGRSQIDEALITGESLPVSRQPGDPVTGGAINGDGRLQIRTTATGSGTVLARIIQLVEEAQAAKAPIQKLVDRISQIFVPGVLLVALLTGLAWAMAGATPETALINAVTVLVIACPCALGLATPAAIMTGTGVAARHGILIRNPEILEMARHISQVAFDKTGTLTAGKPALVECLPIAAQDARDIMSWSGSLQQGSEHPLARAVLEACREQQLTLEPVADSKALPGQGISGTVAGRRLLLGNETALGDLQPPLELQQDAERLENAGQTLSWLIDQTEPPQVLALLAFGDTLKPEARQAVQKLHQMGIRCHLITGDNPGSARQVAEALQLDSIHARVRPEQKSEIIRQLQQDETGGVAMVGDGINDAPALATADIGIAMGEGTDVAMQTAGLTLMRSDPGLVPAALSISRQTYRKIRQNLFWAFIYNLLGLPLAAFGLLNPMIAGAAMALSSVCVISNALLLKRWHP